MCVDVASDCKVLAHTHALAHLHMVYVRNCTDWLIINLYAIPRQTWMIKWKSRGCCFIVQLWEGPLLEIMLVHAFSMTVWNLTLPVTFAMVPLCYVVFQWQNICGIHLGKKQAGYGMQSHASAAEMDAAQPLSRDAKVSTYYVTISPDAKVHTHIMSQSQQILRFIYTVSKFPSQQINLFVIRAMACN